MDVKSIAWVGNIYQKFESLCLEVEEIMYQDTIDFMENRVQTVGSSVKKFYSGVMTDLLPPSPNDLGKKETNETDLQEFKDSEIITKPKFHIKKESLKREIDQVRNRSKILGHVERKKGNTDNVFAFPTTLSVLQNQKQFNDGKVMKENKYCESENRVLENRQSSEVAQQMDRFGRSELSLSETVVEKHGLSVPERQASVVNTKIHHPVEKTMEEYENRTDPSCDLAAPTQDDCSNNGKVSVVEPSTLGDIHRNDIDETISFFQSGPLDSSDIVSTEEPSFPISNLENLEDSCIFVDGDELSFISPSNGKHKPYKKKLRDAFSPRKKSSRAQEYKQLAVKYSAQSDQERDLNGKFANLEVSSQFQHVAESEWELL